MMEGEDAIMLKERIETYYLKENFNCAESMLRSINEEYGLGLENDCLKLAGGFGGGMGCGLACGALSAAIMALGKMAIGQKAHETKGFKELCASFVAAFREGEGEVDCSLLKAMNFQPERRCMRTVQLAADLFEEFAEEHGLVKKG